MPHLDDVTQTFYADVLPYVLALRQAADAAREFAAAAETAAVAARAMGTASASASDGIDQQARAAEYLMIISGQLYGIEEKLGTALVTLGIIQRDTADSSMDLMMANELLRASLDRSDTAIRLQAANLGILRTAMKDMTGGATGGGGGGGGGGFGFWGGWINALGGVRNALHWVILGTAEIAATAIPALVAFGAAIVSMIQPATFLKDQMTNMIIASGSLHNALMNSVPGLQQMGLNMQKVQQYATPNAMIIFGSAISIATMHMSRFSGMAAQASTALANFAAKIVSDLQGSAGAQLQKFFENAVKYMIQWGEVLGTFGHAFLNIFSSMFGVGQLLLDVLTMIGRAFLALTSNPVISVMIGIAAAMSALYRYAQLFVGIWNLLDRIIVQPLIKMATWIATVVTEMAVAIAETGTWTAALVVLNNSLGPIGWAILAIGAALTIWYLTSRSAGDATTQLIKQVQSAPPTIQNLSSGIAQLTNAMTKLQPVAHSLGPVMQGVSSRLAGPTTGLSYSAQIAQGDIANLGAAIQKQAQLLVQLEVATAQAGSTTGLLGHNMLALSVQTDLQDSKVQQLNQAWDQYIGLVTGGTSGLAGMSEALLNIGKVTITSASGLRNYNATVGLTTGQAAQQMRNFGQVGSQVWTNFNNTLTGSLQPLADWMRQALTAGAITAPIFTKSILDMASGLVGFARDSAPARAELVAFAQESGLNIKNFPQLERYIRSTGASTKDLAGNVTAATIAMSNLNDIAKNLSATLSQQETSAIAAAALKASGFTTDINNMMLAEETHKNVGGKSWQEWAAKAAAAQNRVQGDAQQSLAALQREQAFIDTMHGKNIPINIAFSQSGAVPPGQSLPGGYPGGTGGQHGMVVGFQGGGMVSGRGGLDAIHAMLTAGEAVLTARAVAALGGPLAVHNLNARPSQAVLTTGGGGVGSGTLALNQRVNVMLDSSNMGSVWRTDVLVYNRRNPTSNVTLRTR